MEICHSVRMFQCTFDKHMVLKFSETPQDSIEGKIVWNIRIGLAVLTVATGH